MNVLVDVIVTVSVAVGAVNVFVKVAVLVAVAETGAGVTVVTGVEVIFVYAVSGMLMVYVVEGTTATDVFPNLVVQSCCVYAVAAKEKDGKASSASAATT